MIKAETKYATKVEQTYRQNNPTASMMSFFASIMIDAA